MPVNVFTTIDDPLASSGHRGVRHQRRGPDRRAVFDDANSGPHGFLLSGGTFTTLDDPLASGGSTRAFGINDAGQIVGTFTDGGNSMASCSAAAFSRPSMIPTPPSAPMRSASTHAGQIVGSFNDASGGHHGFLAAPPTALRHHASRRPLGHPHRCRRHQRCRPDRRALTTPAAAHGFLYRSGAGGIFTTFDDPLGH